jgi:DNA (cytosine-5)-methyltransferase 1
MRLLDLFSGIGGFSLAASWLGWQTVGFIENDDTAKEILRLRFPGTPLLGSIEDCLKQPGRLPKADVISAGFPCQPFSLAGRRLGSQDDRDLWPQTLEVISKVKPHAILLENSPGIRELGLDRIITQLEDASYSCSSWIIPAAGTGQPIRRNRCWIFAISDSFGSGRHASRIRREQQSLERFRRLKAIPIPFSSRVDDGFSRRLDRLRLLGNSIVPAVAHEFFKAIDDGNSISAASHE